jgi:outer membrane protein assembly factor BamB
MKRTGRIIVTLAALAVVAAGLTFLRPRARRSPVAEALLRAPTTPVSGTGNGAFDPPIQCNQLILVPPLSWEAFSYYNGFSVFTGDVVSGRIRWFHALPVARLRRGTATGREGYALARGAGRMFSTTPGSEVIAVDELSLARLWNFTAAKPVTRLTWSDIGVLVAASDTDLYGIDPDNGQLRWSMPLRGTVEADLYADVGKIIVAVDDDNPKKGRSENPYLVAVDARNGKTLWRTPLPHHPVGVAGAPGEAVYCVTRERGLPDDPTLLRIDAATGQIAWKSSDFGGAPSALPQSPSGPAVGNGLLCVTLEETLYAFDCSTGKRRWTWTAPAQKDRQALGLPTIRDGIVYLTVTGGGVALDSQTGRELWNYHSRPSEYVARQPARAVAPSVSGNLLTLPYADPHVEVVRLPSTLHETDILPAAMSFKFPLAITSAGLLLVALFAGAVLRRLRALIALLCLVALALILWAWIGSYSSTQFLGLKRFSIAGRHRSESAAGLDWADGAVTIGRRQTVWHIAAFPRAAQGNSTAPIWWTRQPRAALSNGVCLEDPATDLGLRRFAWTRRTRPSGTQLGPQSETSLTLPLWSIAALFALPPFAWLTGLWRDRGRYPRGHCPNCGYDLRATPGRCPECGHDTALPCNDTSTTAARQL